MSQSSLDIDSESIHSEDYYEVEKILNRRRASNGFEYLVKWENFPESQSTWEPETHLDNVKWMVDRFNLKLQQKTGLNRKQEKQKLDDLAEKKRLHKRKTQNKREIPRAQDTPRKVGKFGTSGLLQTDDLERIQMVKGDLQLDVPVRILGCRLRGSTIEYAVLFKSRKNCIVLPQAYSHEELKEKAAWLLSQYILDCAKIDLQA